MLVAFPWLRPTQGCPSYTFAMLARPVSAVQNLLKCSRTSYLLHDDVFGCLCFIFFNVTPRHADESPKELPQRVTLSNGFAETQITSFWRVRTDEQLSHLTVNFTVATTSLFVSSLSFDSLVLNADLVLEQHTGDDDADSWTRSVVSASPYRSQPYDMEERLSVRQLEAGAYVLHVRRHAIPAPFTVATACLQFSWFFFLAPRESTPYVLVDPPGGVAMRPEVPLVCHSYYALILTS